MSLHALFLRITKHPSLIILVILGFVPFSWYKPGYLIGYGESTPIFFNAHSTIQNHVFLWDEEAGGYRSGYPLTLIHEALWYFPLRLNIQPSVVQIALIAVLHIIAGLSMGYLALTLYKREVVALIAGIFWMFNFYKVPFCLIQSLWFIFALLPLLLAIYINVQRNVLKKKCTFKEIICFSIISTIYASWVIYPPNFLMVFLALLSIFAMYFFRAKGLRLKLINVNLLLLVASILSNAWWLIPGYFFYFQPRPSLVYGPETYGTIEAITQGSTPLLKIFQLSVTSLWNGARFTNELPFKAFYDNFPVPLLFAPIIMAFSNLLIKKDRADIYLATATLPLFFLSKGINPPFKQFSLFLWTYTPIKFIREPGDVPIHFLLICLALLLGAFVDKILQVKTKILQVKFDSKPLRRVYVSINFSDPKSWCVMGLATITIIAVFIAEPLPILTGDAIPGRYPERWPYAIYMNVYFKIPDYWYEAAKYINQKEGDFKVLIFPISRGPTDYLEGYQWALLTRSFTVKLFEKPTIGQSQGSYYSVKEYYDILMSFSDSIEQCDQEKFAKLLEKSNVGYIIYKNDIAISGKEMGLVERNKGFLGDSPYLELEKTIGKLDIYKVQGGRHELYKLVISENDSVLISNDINNFEVRTGEANFTIDYTSEVDGKPSVKVSLRSHPPPYTDSLSASFYLKFTHTLNLTGYTYLSLYAKLSDQWAQNYVVLRDVNRHCRMLSESLYSTDGKNWTLPLGEYVAEDKYFDISRVDSIYVGAWGKENTSIDIWINKVEFKKLKRVKFGEIVLRTSPIIAEPAANVTISYRKVSPVKYVVHLSLESSPCILRLTEGYDHEWKAYFGDIGWFDSLWKKPINEDKHFAVDGMNAWRMDDVGNYEITLYYVPQSLFYVGVIISILTLTLSMAYLVLQRKLRRKTLGDRNFERHSREHVCFVGKVPGMIRKIVKKFFNELR